jgi:hypothetical protein
LTVGRVHPPRRPRSRSIRPGGQLPRARRTQRVGCPPRVPP